MTARSLVSRVCSHLDLLRLPDLSKVGPQAAAVIVLAICPLTVQEQGLELQVAQLAVYTALAACRVVGADDPLGLLCKRAHTGLLSNFTVNLAYKVGHVPLVWHLEVDLKA